MPKVHHESRAKIARMRFSGIAPTTRGGFLKNVGPRFTPNLSKNLKWSEKISQLKIEANGFHKNEVTVL